MLSEVERFVQVELEGATTSRKDIACHFSDGGRVDTMIDNPYGAAKRAGVDVTCVNTLSPSYITPAAAADERQSVAAAIAEKERRHRRQCQLAGHNYYTAGWTLMGGVFGDFYSRLVRPHFKHAMKLAKAQGDDVWAVQARKDRLLESRPLERHRCTLQRERLAVCRDAERCLPRLGPARAACAR